MHTYCLVGSFPEDCHDKYGGDRRGQVAGHRLDVNVELAAVGVLKDRDPNHADDDEDHRHDPATAQKKTITESPCISFAFNSV